MNPSSGSIKAPSYSSVSDHDYAVSDALFSFSGDECGVEQQVPVEELDVWALEVCESEVYEERQQLAAVAGKSVSMSQVKNGNRMQFKRMWSQNTLVANLLVTRG